MTPDRADLAESSGQFGGGREVEDELVLIEMFRPASAKRWLDTTLTVTPNRVELRSEVAELERLSRETVADGSYELCLPTENHARDDLGGDAVFHLIHEWSSCSPTRRRNRPWGP